MSEKLLATIPKGIVRGFVFAVFLRNLKGHGHIFASAKGKQEK